MPLASVDVGSNSIRLLIGDVLNGNRVRRLRHEREVTRLARGITKTGHLEEGAVEKTLTVLKKYSSVMSESGVGAVKAVGTSALREADNAGEFLSLARLEAGLDIEVVSGREEAVLSAEGVVSSLAVGNSALIVDIGGGSTEATLLEGGAVSEAFSMPVGVVKLLEGCIRHDPPSWEDMKALESAAAEAADYLAGRLSGRVTADTVFIATAGTATTIAAVDLGLDSYDHDKVHGRMIGLGRLTSLLQALSTMPLEERRRVRGLEPERADLIIGGIKLTINIMERLGFTYVVVSDHGLLEGVLLRLFREVSR